MASSNGRVTIPARPRFFSELFICIALVLVPLAVYSPLRRFSFLNFDDPDYVFHNLHVRYGLTWQGIHWAFASGDFANWFPLTWLSHMLDCELFGIESGFHHLSNLAFHIASTLLLFLFLKRATGARWSSAFAAFLFALHPLHVESVAWVAERKDVLNGFFWFLTLFLYARYVERPKLVSYTLVLVAFCVHRLRIGGSVKYKDGGANGEHRTEMLHS